MSRVAWTIAVLTGLFGTYHATGIDRLGGAEQVRDAPVKIEPMQVDDDENLHPGLLARYSSGPESVERIDPDLQFVWRESSPDPRLREGSFKAVWAGQILVRSPGKHRFHAHLQGRVAIKIAGKLVLQGESAKAGWLDGSPVELEFGEHPLEVTFERTIPDAQSRLKLSWSSESFPLEPIPSQVLFHADPRPDLVRLERGERLFADLRCNRCHRREHERLSPQAPALDRTMESLRPGWLLDHLTDRDARPQRRMPKFGLTRDEAQELIGFLGSIRPEKPIAMPRPTGDRRQGELLFRSLGCLACHTHAEPGDEQAKTDESDHKEFTIGGDLTHIGKKRSAEWVGLWLKNPAVLNSAHQMPVFTLSDAERSSLAVYLAGDAPAIVPPDRPAAARHELFVAARCGACHQTGTQFDRVEHPAVKPLVKTVVDWSQSCLADKPDPATRRPSYSLSATDREALQAYVTARLQSAIVKESAFALGARMLRQKGCLNCHDRDGSRGISKLAAGLSLLDDDLHGQSEALIPPDLSAIGDKLHLVALSTAVQGKQPTRLPWLRVRMPTFSSADEELGLISTYFQEHDGLPDRPGAIVPASPKRPPTSTEDAPPAVKTQPHPGEVLLGSKGFNCASCHRIGPLEPRNVALGTRGSDLYRIGDRMRFEFFVRWTRAPLRIVPGMEMPSYERPVAGILDGQIDTQLAAMWEALNNPKAPPAVDGSSVQQVFTVAPGAPARVVRDVFRVGEAGQQIWIPRALAIGFHNRQNLLFDLDSGSLRLWWPGDFARQRTSGKSWFWETGNAVVAPTEPAVPEIVLRGPEGTVIVPEREGTVFAHLRDYAPDGQGLRVRYRLTFKVGEQLVSVEVIETFHPESAPAPSIGRQIQIDKIPAGYTPLLLRPVQRNPFVYGPEREVKWEPLTLKLTVRANGKNVLLELPREGTSLTESGDRGVEFRYGWNSSPNITPAAAPVVQPLLKPESVTVVPGYAGLRLPIDRSIMPTGLTWRKDGTLAFCSLKGHVYLAHDTDGDGLEDSLSVFEEGLAAPYGLIADGDDLIVAHKPELLRLRDTDGDGRADVREVLADGWGYGDNYHDWTCGIVRDSRGNLYVGLGSDYAQPDRDRETSKWRGAVLRIDPAGKVTPLSWGFRYPTGLALTADDQLFVSDNQGVQNTFNEINHIVEGGHYGVPGLTDPPSKIALNPTIRLPHPWTRSVNGLFFLPRSDAAQPFAGQGIGCEYDTRFLVRFSIQKVGESYQGAVYPFSLPPTSESAGGFQGTLCGGVAPNGDIYIGSIHDSGWLGGLNVGDLVRLRKHGKLPLGLREIRAHSQGFVLDLTGPVDAVAAAKPENYTLSAYTRVWQGAYATPDSNRHTVPVQRAEVSADGASVRLTVEKLRPDYVYEITCGALHPESTKSLFPATGHYTLNVLP